MAQRTQRRDYGRMSDPMGYGEPRRHPGQYQGRRRSERPSDLGMYLVCVLAIGVMGLCAWLGMVLTQPSTREQSELPTHKVTHDSMCATQTYDGETIRWYVMVDPDYRIQYLVNDRGGCCVRLDDQGNVMGLSGKDEAPDESDDDYGYPDYYGEGGYDE